MNLSMNEFIELSKLTTSSKQVIKIAKEENSLTIRVKAHEDELDKSIILESKNGATKVDRLGIYDVGGVKVWVVKE